MSNSNVADRQTFVFSTSLNGSPRINTYLNLRFAADELIVKSISYNTSAGADTDALLQIWCNVTNDSLIGSFPNNAALCSEQDCHFRLNNSFQTGNFVLQFQTAGLDTDFHYNPTALNATTNGTVAVTIEFIKLKNKEIY
jgi:hypothetical protein